MSTILEMLLVWLKELDRQLAGQSSTPFMRMASNENYSMQTNNKRGVTFDAMETLERNSDCKRYENDNGQKTVPI